jgi:hypothetical protein
MFLSQMCRQTDMEFIEILNEVRKGTVSEDLLQRLDKCLVGKKQRPEDGKKDISIYYSNPYISGDSGESVKKPPRKPPPTPPPTYIDGELKASRKPDKS